jgi:hypothetical protein
MSGHSIVPGLQPMVKDNNTKSSTVFDKAVLLCHLNPALKYPRGAISGCFRSDAGNAIRLFCAFFSTGSGPIHPSGFISGREGR